MPATIDRAGLDGGGCAAELGRAGIAGTVVQLAMTITPRAPALLADLAAAGVRAEPFPTEPGSDSSVGTTLPPDRARG